MTTDSDLFLSLCNELLAKDGHDLDTQCRIASSLGYRGLELAPGTFGATSDATDAKILGQIRQRIVSHGLAVTGIHWLLAPFPDASLVDPSRRSYTTGILLKLVEQCSLLGGSVLVHGSPSSRQLSDKICKEVAMENAVAVLKPVVARTDDLGLTYCIEPLARTETPFLNTVAECLELVDRVDSGSFLTMIDTSAAGHSEDVAVADLIREWVPKGVIAHVQVNDTNRGAPGMGQDPFNQIVEALKSVSWERPIAVEPFQVVIDAAVTAAIGAATMRALWTTEMSSK
ncbi:MAG: sugar phosphate isomerase/epimerase [Rhodobacteraceae bacterium]|nr:sugar phosphate isomerase/epimerase [Paracoccaceae bacterium]MCY4198045.1 sugar phosphate isomerase/epimerase [Paracoccaceae bacterium]MCY4327736.1 sugar phosphate isomerase/epimerase [Paracoccaceae bacterium]